MEARNGIQLSKREIHGWARSQQQHSATGVFVNIDLNIAIRVPDGRIEIGKVGQLGQDRRSHKEWMRARKGNDEVVNRVRNDNSS